MISLEYLSIKNRLSEGLTVKTAEEYLEQIKSRTSGSSVYAYFINDPVRARHNLRRRQRRTLRMGIVPFWLYWATAGKGVVGLACGVFNLIKQGCLNSGFHPGGKVYVVHHANHCKNPRCPVCVKHWIAREAMRSTDRLMALFDVSEGLLKHIIVSPPRWRWAEFNSLKSYLKLREYVYKLLKSQGIKGGQVVFHPFRNNNKSFSPHFHVLGVGWLAKTEASNNRDGWVIKNLGARTTRKSVYGTLRYELDHCGIAQELKGRSIVSPMTWYGCASYNAGLKVDKIIYSAKCPHCQSSLLPVEWRGDGDHPCAGLVEGEYDLDPGGWGYASGPESLEEYI